VKPIPFQQPELEPRFPEKMTPAFTQKFQRPLMQYKMINWLSWNRNRIENEKYEKK
jgi:hypothetical protein